MSPKQTESFGTFKRFPCLSVFKLALFMAKNKRGHQGFMLPSPQGTYWSATNSQRKRLCMNTVMDIFFPDNTLYILEMIKPDRWEYPILSEVQTKDTHIIQ